MKRTIKYFSILIGFLVFWSLPIIQPLRVFSIYLHQSGRFLAAKLLYYKPGELILNFNESSYTVIHSRGGISEFVLASAGYLGSVLLALLILYLKKTEFNKYLLAGIAIFYTIITINFASDRNALVYSIIFVCAVMISYMLQNAKISSWFIDIIAISSIAYAAYDILVLTIFRQINNWLNVYELGTNYQPLTDSVRLEKITRLPAIIWASIWLVIIVYLTYRFFVKEESKKE